MKIKEIIVVEGRNDVTAVKKACDCEVIITGGLHFNKSLFKTLQKAQEEKGLIIFTDPDYAGERIRKIIIRKIKGVKNAYLSQNKAFSKGDIGIENAKSDDILDALLKAKANFEIEREEFILEDLIAYDLTGDNSKMRREFVGNYLSIGYSNSKQFLRRLNNYNIKRNELEEAIRKFEGK